MNTCHESRRSEDGDVGRPESGETAAAPVQRGRIEWVPGYVKPALPGTPPLPVAPPPPMPFIPPLAEARSAGASEAGAAPPIDAAMKAFKKTPLFDRVVIGDDDRRVVPSTTMLPWRAICALRIISADGAVLVGTGWFIDERTVVTAGHCVFDAESGGWAKSIEVLPARNGEMLPFGKTVGTRFRAVDAWIEDREASCDYGAILLDTDLGRHTGSFKVASLSNAELRSQPVNLAGYPLDLDSATRLYYHARVISTVGATRLFYDIDTFGGQSGSPLWLDLEHDGPIVVGLHTTGSATTNSGTRITSEVLENLSRWRAEAAAPRPSR
jgi:V8-like Glu-specific endopeptidase